MMARDCDPFILIDLSFLSMLQCADTVCVRQLINSYSIVKGGQDDG